MTPKINERAFALAFGKLAGMIEVDCTSDCANRRPSDDEWGYCSVTCGQLALVGGMLMEAGAL